MERLSNCIVFVVVMFERDEIDEEKLVCNELNSELYNVLDDKIDVLSLIASNTDEIDSKTSKQMELKSANMFISKKYLQRLDSKGNK